MNTKSKAKCALCKPNQEMKQTWINKIKTEMKLSPAPISTNYGSLPCLQYLHINTSKIKCNYQGYYASEK